MKINVIQPIYPTPTIYNKKTKCSKCGMVWEGVMAYVCSSSDCPVQLKVTSQTYNTTTATKE